jgi:single-strand DNA-binding protein
MNLAIIKGNLTRDPELKYTPKGTAVCKCSVAVNEVWKTEAGEKQERVHFFDLEAWGRTAETIAQYFTKGKPILIQGKLKQDTWDDRETGQKRSKVKITIDSFEFCGDTKAGSEGGDRRVPQRGQRAAESAQPDADYEQAQPDSDDAPF